MSDLFCNFKTAFTVEETDYVSSSRKDTWVAVDSGLGLLTPNNDRTQQFRETNWGKEFFLDTYPTVNIKTGNRAIINSQVYDVNHVTENIDPDGNASYLRCILFKTDSTKRKDAN